MHLTNPERLSSVVDYQQLIARCLNKLDFAERMLSLFQNHCAEELAVLERAFAEDNLESMRLVSHRLGGAAANAAAFGLKQSASELRIAASSGSREQTERALHDLQKEWQRFNAVMSEDAQPSPST